MKAQVMASKLEWDRKFNQSMHQQRQVHINEERQQSEGEISRNSGFIWTVYNMNEAFDTKTERWIQSFLDAQEKRENLFRVNEDSRENRFSKGEIHRGAMFQQDQDMCRKLSDWYVGICWSHFERGRLKRADMCQKLEDELVEQFESLLRFQEECFASAERQRDEIVGGIVSRLISRIAGASG